MSDHIDHAEHGYWRRYCPEHDADHLEHGRCPVDNVLIEIRDRLDDLAEVRS